MAKQPQNQQRGQQRRSVKSLSLQTSRPLAKEREKLAKEEISRMLVVRGLDDKAAKDAASEIVAAGFCIIGGGVPI